MQKIYSRNYYQCAVYKIFAKVTNTENSDKIIVRKRKSTIKSGENNKVENKSKQKPQPIYLP